MTELAAATSFERALLHRIAAAPMPLRWAGLTSRAQRVEAGLEYAPPLHAGSVAGLLWKRLLVTDGEDRVLRVAEGYQPQLDPETLRTEALRWRAIVEIDAEMRAWWAAWRAGGPAGAQAHHRPDEGLIQARMAEIRDRPHEQEKPGIAEFDAALHVWDTLRLPGSKA
jgi:hypothetical protein